MRADTIYRELRTNLNISEIAKNLSLHIGTLKRWEATNKVPQEYIYDLNFLLGNKYDLKKENFRSYNEFFTKKEVASYCFEGFLDFLKLHKINTKAFII